MPAMSTLVETVSINYEDFNESFLTCATCLRMYDNADRAPKLLPCSHTVCRSCLERIATVAGGPSNYERSDDTSSSRFRCPICRETIQPPQGGIPALPPSFLVNQLLDLMARQRREIVPKCAVHMSQELLFCETCDVIFCMICQGGSHSGSHTAIPFSVAIKRVSEILLYKAHLCIQNLDLAREAVQREQQRLSDTLTSAESAAARSFDDALQLLQRRRAAVSAALQAIAADKQRVLDEQLQVIAAERRRVEDECQGLDSQLEVRNITKRIVDLNECLDATTTLLEPRENAFIRYEWQQQLKELTDYVLEYGKVTVSTTFPSLCHVTVDEAVTHLECRATLTTVDYRGSLRSTGGDPVCARVLGAAGEPLACCLRDRGDGTYGLSFVPLAAGEHALHVTIFDRHVKGSPFAVSVSDHNSPLSRVGVARGGGRGALEFSQPTALARDAAGNVYVADTGNCRIKVLAADGSVRAHLLPGAGLEQQGCTGLAVTSEQTLVLVNWRTKLVTEIATADGHVLAQFTAPGFVEPTALAVGGKGGEIVVADSAADSLFVFDRSGSSVRQLRGGAERRFSAACGIAIGASGEIVVAGGSLVHVVDATSGGSRVRAVGCQPGKVLGQYGGVAIDGDGNILATRTEKGRGYVDVFLSDASGTCYVIDSFADKLKRPSGVVAIDGYRAVVCDLGNNCLKTYRYK